MGDRSLLPEYDALQERPAADAGGDELQLIALGKLADGEDVIEIPDAHGACLLCVFLLMRLQDALEVAAQAFDAGGGDHRFRSAADAQHHIDLIFRGGCSKS